PWGKERKVFLRHRTPSYPFLSLSLFILFASVRRCPQKWGDHEKTVAGGWGWGWRLLFRISFDLSVAGSEPMENYTQVPFFLGRLGKNPLAPPFFGVVY